MEYDQLRRGDMGRQKLLLYQHYIQNRAARFFMGVGPYTSNAATMGDMGWTSTDVKQWGSVLNHWYRLRSMDENRINSRVFKWAAQKGNSRCKNWCFRLKQQFAHCNIQTLFYEENIHLVSKDFVKQKIKQKLSHEYIMSWHNELERNVSRSGNGGNKLRTYRSFKHTYETETYISTILPRRYRSAYAKFRCGVAPIRLETGRYERLQVEQRTCFQCVDNVETEEHVLLMCPLYDDLRLKLFDSLITYFPFFGSLNESQKLSVILS